MVNYETRKFLTRCAYLGRQRKNALYSHTHRFANNVEITRALLPFAFIIVVQRDF